MAANDDSQQQPRRSAAAGDFVERVLANEFSETLKDEVRQLGRLAREEEEDSSLDPIEDLDLFIEHQIPMTPPAYEAVRGAFQQDLNNLERIRDPQLDPEQRRIIDSRRQLVEGTPLEDVKWLKLKAYHQAMRQLQPVKAQAAAASSGQPLPQAAGGEASNSGTSSSRLGQGAADDTESEWAPGWDSRQYLRPQELRQHPLLAAVSARLLGKAAKPAPQPASGSGARHAEALRPYRRYTQEHLALQERERQLAAHRRQKGLLFCGGLAAVAVYELVRMLRRRSKGSKGRQPPSSRISESGRAASA